MELVNFLVLRSPNIGNIGTVKQRPEGFINPDYYQISEEELESFKAMSTAHRNAFISEKLEAQSGTPVQVKKKVAPVVEVVESQVELESAEMPETEIEEPLNEPVNEIEETQEILKEVAQDLSEITGETIVVKAKGRPKKVK